MNNNKTIDCIGENILKDLQTLPLDGWKVNIIGLWMYLSHKDRFYTLLSMWNGRNKYNFFRISGLDITFSNYNVINEEIQLLEQKIECRKQEILLKKCFPNCIK